MNCGKREGYVWAAWFFLVLMMLMMYKCCRVRKKTVDQTVGTPDALGKFTLSREGG